MSNETSFCQTNFMEIALQEAVAAFERMEVPVGAVIVDVKSNEILARAGNRIEEMKDPTAHAEMLVIRQVATESGDIRLSGCDLYVTLEPCPMCATAISFARLRRVYFGASDTKGGGVENGPRIFEQPTCHHRPDVYGGIGASNATSLLKSFFASRR